MLTHTHHKHTIGQLSYKGNVWINHGKRWCKRWSMICLVNEKCCSHPIFLHVTNQYSFVCWSCSDYLHSRAQMSVQSRTKQRYLGQQLELAPGRVWKTLTSCKAAHCWMNWSLGTGHQTPLRGYQTCSDTQPPVYTGATPSKCRLDIT